MASSNNSYEASFRDLIHDHNAKRWTDLETRLLDIVVVDGESLPRGHFRDYLHNDLAGEGDTKEVRIDAILVDVDSKSIAARLINHVTLVESTKAFEYQEIVLANFINNLLSNWQTVRDEDGFRSREPTVPCTPLSSSSSFNNPPSPLKTPAELKSFYRSYINSINEKTMAKEFDNFCQPKLNHNGRELTIAEYIPLISNSQDAIEGLHFHVQELFADGETQQVAARLQFTGTPVKEWAGAKPNGKPVNFHEHVMYQLEHGRISRVWSTIELDVYRNEMGKAIS
ncbi:snoaL-like polyketide cyclase [Colletotrichum tofieldiae]|uniref:SnoaL-like polyketide cyclase n=1 Tax=Colletotrichum tofieldiae TaxID=708197 RepID=A0A166N4S9_9PEZI|nr:SnoaL-like polyketide cyclase [Colletotrichum tofieldiae]GKT63219.1 SnoaL-like polyketide cyclase [Colletotrichum tofieldiae]GKT72769.1 snoaL-like polyketide cyclase [Colletotrichum tofieldiae]GKT89388.1 snoaL-like polyketide cyclase [Colletotrichum tofieldiae]